MGTLNSIKKHEPIANTSRCNNCKPTVVEAVFLLILAVLAYKKRGCAPEYNEEVQLRIELWPNAGVWQAIC